MMLFLVLDVSSVQYVWYYVVHIFVVIRYSKLIQKNQSSFQPVSVAQSSLPLWLVLFSFVKYTQWHDNLLSARHESFQNMKTRFSSFKGLEDYTPTKTYSIWYFPFSFPLRILSINNNNNNRLPNADLFFFLKKKKSEEQKRWRNRIETLHSD